MLPFGQDSGELRSAPTKIMLSRSQEWNSIKKTIITESSPEPRKSWWFENQQIEEYNSANGSPPSLPPYPPSLDLQSFKRNTWVLFDFELWGWRALKCKPYARHHNPLLILTIHKARILRKKPLKKTFLDFKKWVRNIQTRVIMARVRYIM